MKGHFCIGVFIGRKLAIFIDLLVCWEEIEISGRKLVALNNIFLLFLLDLLCIIFLFMCEADFMRNSKI